MFYMKSILKSLKSLNGDKTGQNAILVNIFETKFCSSFILPISITKLLNPFYILNCCLALWYSTEGDETKVSRPALSKSYERVFTRT